MRIIIFDNAFPMKVNPWADMTSIAPVFALTITHLTDGFSLLVLIIGKLPVDQGVSLLMQRELKVLAPLGTIRMEKKITLLTNINSGIQLASMVAHRTVFEMVSRFKL
uniref:Uncharacterized protein n=1 Tax=Opuntia streptacantha TaxID=393608 RepID=A0A7C9ERU9_OPUST